MLHGGFEGRRLLHAPAVQDDNYLVRYFSICYLFPDRLRFVRIRNYDIANQIEIGFMR